MAQDESYQTSIYHERGGDNLVLGSGGMGRLESGGAIIPHRVVINPGVGETFSVADLPFSQGIVILSAGAAAAWSASMRLGPCSVGADIYLILRGDPTGTFTNETAEVDISISGGDCTILDSVGSTISGWEMYTSAASDPWVHLKCFTDDVWSIVGTAGNIDE